MISAYTCYQHTNTAFAMLSSFDGRGPRVVVSATAFHARVWGSFDGLSGLKETTMFLPHPLEKLGIVGSLRDRKVVCSASDLQRLNFESCIWRAVSSHSPHHPQEVLLAQSSLYVHKQWPKARFISFVAYKTQLLLCSPYLTLTHVVASISDCNIQPVRRWRMVLNGSIQSFNSQPIFMKFCRPCFGIDPDNFVKKYRIVQKLDHLTCSKCLFMTLVYNMYKPINFIQVYSQNSVTYQMV